MSTQARDQFDALAQAYLTSAVHAQGEDLRCVAQRLAGQPQARVLDLGCGAGHLSFAMAPGVAAVVAYDLAPRMLEVVAQAARERGLRNIETCQGPVEQLPFADASFDWVCTRFSAHHWDDLGAALKQARRVLRPGGGLIVIDVLGDDDPLTDTHLQSIELLRDPSHVRDYDAAEWRAAIAAAGFRIVDERRWPLALDFNAWVARSRTPPLMVDALRQLLASAPAGVRERLAVQADGSFSSVTGLFEARG
jgi:ubiquinone/menaquinone biosynthesis C-methylase UbiE